MTLLDLGRKLSAQALEKVATKDDLKALKDDLKDDVKALEERIDLKLGALEDRMNDKLGSLEERLGDKLEAQEERMDVKFDGLQKETKADLTVAIAKLQTEMYKALGVQTLALLGLGFALFKLFG